MLEIFASTMQQDAHEMLNYLINEIAETLTKHKKDFKEKLASRGLHQKYSNVEPPGLYIYLIF